MIILDVPARLAPPEVYPKRTIVVVLSPENVARMQAADPVTIDTALRELNLVIAIEPDADQLAQRFQGNAVEIMRHLERGWKFRPGVDGVVVKKVKV